VTVAGKTRPGGESRPAAGHSLLGDDLDAPILGAAVGGLVAGDRAS